MITALPEAVELWNDPAAMIADWEYDLGKRSMEQTVAEWVGTVSTVADLGCGVGRYAQVLNSQVCDYYGFDATLAMIHKATENWHPDSLKFAQVDVFEYSSDRDYDVVLMIDVAQHQDDPIGAVVRMFELWKGDRYIFTILCGDRRERVLNSFVEDRCDVGATLKALGTKILRSKHYQVGSETFESILMEVRCARRTCD